MPDSKRLRLLPNGLSCDELSMTLLVCHLHLTKHLSILRTIPPKLGRT